MTLISIFCPVFLSLFANFCYLLMISLHFWRSQKNFIRLSCSHSSPKCVFKNSPIIFFHYLNSVFRSFLLPFFFVTKFSFSSISDKMVSRFLCFSHCFCFGFQYKRKPYEIDITILII